MHWQMQTTVWAVLALLLIAAEVIAPGAFLLWLGIAAAITCGVVLLFPELAPAAQMVVFAVLSVASVLVYRRMFRGREIRSDRPSLNRRAEQLVGHVVPLATPIVAGRGRVQIADAFWDVEGPDLPTGTRVRVIGVRGMTLEVRPQD